MEYDNYFLGMSFVWWIIWMILLFWIFATPYEIPYQRSNKNTPLFLLQKRFASGKINAEEYDRLKKILEKDTDQDISIL